MEKKKHKRRKEILDYDASDTTTMIDRTKPLRFEELGLTLPPMPPTQVVSIRLPSHLLNELKAIGSQQDVPYQAVIKLMLADAVGKKKKAA